ncbi:phage tail protein [Luteibacter yeojuensis]|uniref:Phage tail protein n=1 Tax=Luteibacter yeojuensis TaxID=345309 RepID=A0A7X5QW02_9GAMM|nr:tail fiber protein [Luteibacter yeojuensis]NID16464.1 phage tail protein [Luteibacter yeojuensis]
MSTFYLGQIMLTGFNFAPKGFARCDGSLMSIAQNQALFALLGTMYGGDGVTTFALPDLRGRTPIAGGGNGSRYNVGQTGGSESVTLTPDQIPPHMHFANFASGAGQARNPAAGLYGQTTADHPIYANASGTQVPMDMGVISGGGQGQPHSNMQPYTVLNFCIATTGVFPSRT